MKYIKVSHRNLLASDLEHIVMKMLKKFLTGSLPLLEGGRFSLMLV
jgi:hypothetical protein